MGSPTDARVIAAALVMWPLGLIIVLAVCVVADLVFFLTGRRP